MGEDDHEEKSEKYDNAERARKAEAELDKIDTDLHGPLVGDDIEESRERVKRARKSMEDDADTTPKGDD